MHFPSILLLFLLLSFHYVSLVFFYNVNSSPLRKFSITFFAHRRTSMGSNELCRGYYCLIKALLRPEKYIALAFYSRSKCFWCVKSTLNFTLQHYARVVFTYHASFRKSYSSCWIYIPLTLFTDFLADYIGAISRRLKLNCQCMKFNVPDGRWRKVSLRGN